MMQPLNTLSQMMAGAVISVPDYQRAYAWDTKDSGRGQVNTFLQDLKEHVKSGTDAPYYLGHFLFELLTPGEDAAPERFAVVDGQQRLTTAVIFTAAAFRRLLELRGAKRVEDLAPELADLYAAMVKTGMTYRFSTVSYDKLFFRDFVIDGVTRSTDRLETLSAGRIAAAYAYFVDRLSELGEDDIHALLRTAAGARVSAHTVESTAEAMQMFIFENNRGKKPSDLEIIKAKFMHSLRLRGGEAARPMLEEITERFEKIYRSIARIEDRVDEGDVLGCTLRVHRNDLDPVNALEYIDTRLAEDSSLDFIRTFTRLLSACFEQITTFLVHEKEDMAYHALLLSGTPSLMFPFMVKAGLSGMSQEGRDRMAAALEQIFLRRRLIGTRANLLWRLNDAFKKMEADENVVINHINWLKGRKDWWGYWNDETLAQALAYPMDHATAKILLWKYENHLIADGKQGYRPIRFDSIRTPHLEHIAPATENQDPDNGYCPYDDEFRDVYLNSIGNFLLLSGSHNESLSNGRFAEKRASYTGLRQQIEVRDMTENDRTWDKAKIAARREKIIAFLLSVL